MLLYVYNLTFESVAAFEASKPDPRGRENPWPPAGECIPRNLFFYFFAPSHHHLTTGAFSH